MSLNYSSEILHGLFFVFLFAFQVLKEEFYQRNMECSLRNLFSEIGEGWRIIGVKDKTVLVGQFRCSIF